VGSAQPGLDAGGLPDAARELGSDFHEVDVPWTGSPGPWAAHPHAYFGAGRDVLIAGLRPKRLWVPSYFCQEVLRSWLAAGIELRLYEDGPGAQRDCSAQPDAGDVVLTVAYFGVRPPPRLPSVPPGVMVLEDHTHDPYAAWARDSRADYAFASLRKTLPVPDGAVVWSPRGLPLAEAPPLSEARALAAAQRLEAMTLKRRYLRGEHVSKEAFRRLAVGGEHALARSGPAAPSAYARALLEAFPHDAWREARARNHRAFCEAAPGLRGARVLASSGEGGVPFSILLELESRALRDRLRAALIAHAVYPAILWSLDEPAIPGLSPSTRDFASRMLSLHCDGRYGPSDMVRLAAFVSGALEADA
jgi:hypothetical protein